VTADKFGAEYARSSGAEDDAEFMSGTGQRLCVPYAASKCSCATDDREELVDTIKILREALQEAWKVFDALGAHAPDDDRLSILRSSQFSSAAYRVRTAMLKTRMGI